MAIGEELACQQKQEKLSFKKLLCI